MALRLGPNLRAIAPLESSEWDQNLTAFIHNKTSDVMPNLAYKRTTPSCAQNYNSNARVSTTYPRLRPLYLYKNDDPTGVLELWNSAAQLKFNC